MEFIQKIAEWYKAHKIARALTVGATGIAAATAAEVALELARPQEVYADSNEGTVPSGIFQPQVNLAYGHIGLKTITVPTPDGHEHQIKPADLETLSLVLVPKLRLHSDMLHGDILLGLSYPMNATKIDHNTNARISGQGDTTLTAGYHFDNGTHFMNIQGIAVLPTGEYDVERDKNKQMNIGEGIHQYGVSLGYTFNATPWLGANAFARFMSPQENTATHVQAGDSVLARTSLDFKIKNDKDLKLFLGPEVGFLYAGNRTIGGHEKPESMAQDGYVGGNLLLTVGNTQIRLNLQSDQLAHQVLQGSVKNTSLGTTETLQVKYNF